MASINKHIALDGKVSFRARVRLRGYSVATASFERLTDARRWIQDTESSMREGRYFKSAEAKKRTLSELIRRYLQEFEGTSLLKDRKQHLAWWDEAIGASLLFDITPAAIIDCKRRLSVEKGPKDKVRSAGTINRYLATLSALFTYGVREVRWLEDNPMSKVRRAKESLGRVRFLSDDERTRFLASCKKSPTPALYPIVVLALSTGMRRGEILNLRWEDVDLARKRITLQKTKNKTRRAVPVHGHCFDVLKEWSKIRSLQSKLVFPGLIPGKTLDFGNAWDTAVKRANLEDFRFHDLRHTAASYLAMNGASLLEISEILGHRTLAMVKRYAHLCDSHTSKVVEAMNERIFGAS